jgi:hypothetical protein
MAASPSRRMFHLIINHVAPPCGSELNKSSKETQKFKPHEQEKVNSENVTMKFTILGSALALASGALSAPSVVTKRNPTGSFEIIAYGIEDAYIKTFYSDGNQYRPPKQ